METGFFTRKNTIIQLIYNKESTYIFRKIRFEFLLVEQFCSSLLSQQSFCPSQIQLGWIQAVVVLQRNNVALKTVSSQTLNSGVD